MCYACSPRSICSSILSIIHDVCPRKGSSFPPHLSVCVLPCTPRSLCFLTLPIIHSVSYSCTPMCLCSSRQPTYRSWHFPPPVRHRPTVPQYSMSFTVCQRYLSPFLSCVYPLLWLLPARNQDVTIYSTTSSPIPFLMVMHLCSA